MKQSQILLLVILFSILTNIQAQTGVGIGTSSPNSSAALDISSTTKGLLIPRLTETQRLSLVSPANGLIVFQTDGNAGLYYNIGSNVSPIWRSPGTNEWTVGGNSLTGTGSLGTLSNNHIDLITNGVIRGRLSNLGEFLIGTTNTTIIGDLMSGVSNSSFPFAVNGYSSFDGSGVFGSITSGTTQFAGVQGEYSGSGAFNTAGIRGLNRNPIAGTGFRTLSTTGPRAGIIGNTTVSNGQYTFGLHGTMGSTDIRCGGVFGDDFGLALGSLGYFASNLVDYSVYGFGNAFQIGTANGRSGSQINEASTHIGLGIYGGVMGGWVKGLVYGTHLQGNRYSLYVDGKTYTNQPITELITNTDGSRTPSYSISALEPTLYARGKSSLQNGRQYIAFDADFMNKIDQNPESLVITVSPLGNSKGIYIASQDAKGFYVQENDNGQSTISFSWIAIAVRKDADKIVHSPELLQKDFDKKMNGVMFNDLNTTDTPQPIWWDGKQIRFDNPPPKKPLTNYEPKIKVKSSQLSKL